MATLLFPEASIGNVYVRSDPTQKWRKLAHAKGAVTVDAALQVRLADIEDEQDLPGIAWLRPMRLR